MLPVLESFLKLQQCDQKIQAFNEEIAAFPHQKKQRENQLESDRSAVQKAKEAIQQNELAIKKVELDIGTRQQSIARLKQQQFETRKNEEFKAIGEEIVNYTKDVTTLEDQELELMEKTEALKAELQATQQTLAQHEKKIQEELQILTERLKESETKKQALLEKRQEDAKEIPKDDLDLYTRIAKSKKGDALASLEHEVCMGCHVKVTPAIGHAVHAQQKITQCDNCGKILYLLPGS